MRSAVVSKPEAGCLAAAKQFGRYKREPKQDVRTQKIKEDQTLLQLKQAWKKFKLTSRFRDDQVYDDVLSIVKGLKYSAKDVERFSIALAEFQEEQDFETKAGYFLSALMNNGIDMDYIIHTAHLPLINYLGYKNQKSIMMGIKLILVMKK